MVGKSLLGKHFVAGANHSFVAVVHIVDEKPGADAVVGQCASLFFQFVYILVEYGESLFVRVFALGIHIGNPEMM